MMKVLVAAMSLPVDESTALIRASRRRYRTEAGAARQGPGAGSC